MLVVLISTTRLLNTWQNDRRFFLEIRKRASNSLIEVIFVNNAIIELSLGFPLTSSTSSRLGLSWRNSVPLRLSILATSILRSAIVIEVIKKQVHVGIRFLCQASLHFLLPVYSDFELLLRVLLVLQKTCLLGLKLEICLLGVLRHKTISYSSWVDASLV